MSHPASPSPALQSPRHSDPAASHQSSTASLAPEKPPSRRCTPIAHPLHEAANSRFISTKYILQIRLFSTAYLISHAVFFTLHKDLDYHLYSSWNFILHTLATLAALFSSLLHLIREDPAQPTLEDPLPPISPPAPTGPLHRLLPNLAVPLFHVSLTAVVTSTLLQWAFVQEGPPTYAQLSIHVAVPALALLDFALAATMRFRLLYIPVLVAYNALYAFALYIWNKGGEPVYEFLDPDQPRGEFIAKIVGLSAGSVLAAVVIYLLSNVGSLSCLKTESGNEMDESSVSSDTLSPAASPGGGGAPKDEGVLQLRSERELDLTSVTVLEEEIEAEVDVDRECDTRDRTSLPLFRSASGKAMWTRMTSSRSSSSVGDDERISRMPRNDSRNSNWSADLEVSAKLDEEFFRMPAVYTGEDEVIRLARVDSRRMDSGGFGRTTSWRIGSGRLSASSSAISNGATSRGSGGGFGS